MTKKSEHQKVGRRFPGRMSRNVARMDGMANVRQKPTGSSLEGAQDHLGIGSNLFSSWREQTEEEQRRIYNEIGLGEFTEVRPLPCTDPNRLCRQGVG